MTSCPLQGSDQREARKKAKQIQSTMLVNCLVWRGAGVAWCWCGRGAGVGVVLVWAWCWCGHGAGVGVVLVWRGAGWRLRSCVHTLPLHGQ